MLTYNHVGGCLLMQKQSGSFLLQALLALSLIIAFMPFFAQKLASKTKNTEMYIATTQLETVQNAAKIYLRENINDLNYGTMTFSGTDFSDLLEPYGLPLGFVPKTLFGGDISFTIINDQDKVNAYLKIAYKKTSEIEKQEFIRRIGFYASKDGNNIIISVPVEEIFSDIVQINDKDPDKNPFLSDLDLNNFSLNDVKTLYGRRGEFETVQTNALSVNGLEEYPKLKNDIKNISADKTVFQANGDASAFSLTRGTLKTNNVYAKTISKFGNTGSFYSTNASVSDFSMTAGKSGFYGPPDWEVKGDLITDNVNFSVEKLEISSFLNLSRGQNVYITSDEIEYDENTGINAETVHAGNITLRDQISSALSSGETGSVILDIRPAGTSILPDVLITGINNDSFSILSNPSDSGGGTTTCKAIITGLNKTYNSKSLAQNIICQYVFWNRLEQRINIKKCLMDGNSGC